MTDNAPQREHAIIVFEKTKQGDMHLRISKEGKTVDIPLTMVAEQRKEMDLSVYVTPQELLESLIN